MEGDEVSMVSSYVVRGARPSLCPEPLPTVDGPRLLHCYPATVAPGCLLYTPPFVPTTPRPVGGGRVETRRDFGSVDG